MSSGSSRSPSRERSRSKTKQQKNKMFVTNLDGSAIQEELKAELEKLFQKYGTIKDLSVKKSKNKEYCFAFVQYDAGEDAEEAIRKQCLSPREANEGRAPRRQQKKKRFRVSMKQCQQRLLQLWKEGTFCQGVQIKKQQKLINIASDNRQGRGRRSRSKSSDRDRDRKRRNRSESESSERPKKKKSKKEKSQKKKKKHHKKSRNRSSSGSRS